MANLTKAQRASEEKIKQAIYRGYQRGVCDSDGKHIKNDHGMPVKKPRSGHVTRRFVKLDDGTWGWVATEFGERYGLA